jgi:hypothetical protein
MRSGVSGNATRFSYFLPSLMENSISTARTASNASSPLASTSRTAPIDAQSVTMLKMLRASASLLPNRMKIVDRNPCARRTTPAACRRCKPSFHGTLTCVLCIAFFRTSFSDCRSIALSLFRVSRFKRTCMMEIGVRVLFMQTMIDPVTDTGAAACTRDYFRKAPTSSNTALNAASTSLDIPAKAGNGSSCLYGYGKSIVSTRMGISRLRPFRVFSTS